MKRIFAFVLALVGLMSSFVLFASAAYEYNYKGFQLYVPNDFIQDYEWAKKYNYVDYWHSENYGIEMVLIDSDFPEGEFMEKHPDEPHYDCHILHDQVYGYSSEILSEEEIEINGNAGKKTTYRKKIQLTEESEWETFSLISYVFEKNDDYYEVRFYLHKEAPYGFFPEMIMDSFDISPFTFFLRNRTWIITLCVIPLTSVVVQNIKSKKKYKAAKNNFT